jgi:hypothetical protein
MKNKCCEPIGRGAESVKILLTLSCVPEIVNPDNTVVSELTVTVTTLPDIVAVTAEPTKFIPVAADVTNSPSS